MRRLLVALVAAGALALGGPVAAQVDLPPLPLPTVPPEAQPVLEVVGPIVSPQCGNAILGVGLGLSQLGSLGIPLPFNPLPLFGPVFVICGAVPVQAGSSELVCAVDDQTLALLTIVTAQAIGSPPPVDSRLVGPLAETVVVLEDNLPPPADTAGLADQVAGALACRRLRSSGRVGDDTALEDAAPDTAAPNVLTDDVDVPALSATDALPLDDVGAAPIPGAVVSAAPALRPVADLDDGPAFAYPVVFALPLIFLLAGAYLGWALTRPVARP